jgi:uncharacterized protein YcfJ
MKKLLLTSLALASAGAFAQESGRVISSTPVVQQVAVQRQVCNTQQVAVQPQPSGGGAILGAIAGGLIGNTIGHGGGRALATMGGIVAGGALGNSIESSQQAGAMQNMQNCAPQTSYENRTVGYNVTYEYNGRQYTVQMANDPGPTVPLQVTPVGAARGPAAGQGLVTAPPIAADGAAPVVVDQTVQTVPSVVYPSYTVVRPAYYPAYPSYWVPPVSLSLGYVWYGGGHHRHWR